MLYGRYCGRIVPRPHGGGNAIGMNCQLWCAHCLFKILGIVVCVLYVGGKNVRLDFLLWHARFSNFQIVVLTVELVRSWFNGINMLLL